MQWALICKAARGVILVQVLQKASEEDRLVTAALNTHGTRAVQKLIETLATREQVCNMSSSHLQQCSSIYHLFIQIACTQLLSARVEICVPLPV